MEVIMQRAMIINNEASIKELNKLETGWSVVLCLLMG